MKKLFTLISALLLWQATVVAQNYLHITSGDSTKMVRMSDLDSVTVRPKDFYRMSIHTLNGTRYTNTVVDFWGSTFTFDVTLVTNADGTVLIQNLDPFFAESGFVASRGYNILSGTLEFAEDGKMATITCPSNQAMGYSDCVFQSMQDESQSIVFSVTESTLSCLTGFCVYTQSQGGYFSGFNPFTLNKAVGSRTAAPKRRMGEASPMTTAKPKHLMVPATPSEQPAANQLMKAPENPIIE